MKHLIAFAFVAATLAGCRSSHRSILLAESELQIQPAVQIPLGLVPVAVNRDGTRLALVRPSDRLGGDAELLVVDVDSMKTLGSAELSSTSAATPTFSLDGKTLHYDAGSEREGNRAGSRNYVAWDYANDVTSPLPYEPHQVPLLKELGYGGWNYDRTIGIRRPTASTGQRVDGQIGLAEATPVRIPFGSSSGFDQFGNAWFGTGNRWTMVERSGKQTQASASPFLVIDQTTDRGSMHLRLTENEMKYQGASAFVGSVWLSHDRAIRSSKGRRVPAALVYAGADVLTFGFVPGRDMVYVVTATGCFLISWKSGPGESDPGRNPTDRVRIE